MKGKVSTLKFPKKFNVTTSGISQSAMCDFMQCRQKWLFRVNQLQSADRNKSVNMGDIVHLHLEHHYGQNLPTTESIQPIEDFKTEAYVKIDGMTPEQLEVEFSVAEILVDAYKKHYASELETINVMSVEDMVKVPIGRDTDNQTVATIKMDMLYNLKSQPTNYYVMDHKTRGRIDEEGLLQYLTMDLQTRYYALGASRMLKAEKIKGTVKGVIYNIIRNPQIRRKVNETLSQFCDRLTADIATRPEFYFMRFAIDLIPRDIKEAEADAEKIFSDMGAVRDGELPIYKNTVSCLFPYKCEYLTACATNSLETLKVR